MRNASKKHEKTPDTQSYSQTILGETAMAGKKQRTLSFGSSSTSSTSFTSSGQTDAEIKTRIEDPVTYCKKQQERSVPKPSKDGSHFTLFANAEVRKKGEHRSVTKTAASLQTWSTKAVKQELPILSLLLCN